MDLRNADIEVITDGNGDTERLLVIIPPSWAVELVSLTDIAVFKEEVAGTLVGAVTLSDTGMFMRGVTGASIG